MSPLPGNLFTQPWWLNAVAPGRWDRAEVSENGEVVAHLPYVERKEFGLTVLDMPPLTQNLGPWTAPLEGKYETRLSREIKLLEELIDRLPAFDLFRQNFAPEAELLLPFQWRGFSSAVHYTHVLPDVTDPEKVWDAAKSNKRRNIRKARELVDVEATDELDVLLDLLWLSYGRRNREPPYDRELVFRVDEACSRRDCRQILLARDEHGNVHAGAYVVWFDDTSYYLMGGFDPDHGSSGAMTEVLWQAIQRCSEFSTRFDFEGSMVRGIARFFQAFGAHPVPYYAVTKQSPRMAPISALRRTARAVRGWLP